ncbi:MAG: DUF1800 domain-containing protein [Sphingomonadaceae bacterium]|nr:DUF1800 domain-containing protein [Sphingomonadaceae bacterium]
MDEIVIAWNRFGLGGRQQDRVGDDPRHALLRQFDRFDPRPAMLRERPTTADAIAHYKRLTEAQRNQRQQARAKGMAISEAQANAPEAIQQMRRDMRQAYLANVHARAASAIASNAPFVERLVHFWANHFAVSIEKGAVTALSGPHEFEAIRPHVLGNFRHLLRAASLHPAMQLFLDQAQSIGPNSQLAQRAATRGRDAGLNENLAREILELHTLGVRSGYTQGDVTELARAMTGWTVDGFRRMSGLKVFDDHSAYLPQIHEPGARQVLGRRYANNGAQQVLDILDDLATHPATAHHIATKLARHFAGDEPPATLVSRLESAFLGSNGDLLSTYIALVEAPEAWAAQPLKFRQPWEWVIASLRAMDAAPPSPQMLNGLLVNLGQPTWQPGSPAGFADEASHWAAPDALIRRVESGQRMARLAREQDIPALAERLFPDSLGEHTRLALARAESPQQAMALLLAAPEMMRR